MKYTRARETTPVVGDVYVCKATGMEERVARLWVPPALRKKGRDTPTPCAEVALMMDCVTGSLRPMPSVLLGRRGQEGYRLVRAVEDCDGESSTG